MFKSLLLPWKHTKTKVMVPEQTMEDEELLNEQKLVSCKTCCRTFLPLPLKKHAPVCEKNSLKKRKIFDSLKQRIEGTDIAQFHQKSYLRKQESTPKTTEINKNQWEENHRKLVDAIRSAKGASKDMSSTKKSQVVASSPNERCPFCERQFGPKAFERHVEWCKEHRTRVQKSPANVLLAKERLEARTKYKVPPLNKSKRVTIKEKYSTTNLNRTESVCSVKSTPSNVARRNPSIKKPASVLDLGKKSESPAKFDKSNSVMALDEAKKNKEQNKNSRSKRYCPPRERINSNHNENLESITVSPLKLIGFPAKKVITWKEISETCCDETQKESVIVVYENSNVFRKKDNVRNQSFIKMFEDMSNSKSEESKRDSSSSSIFLPEINETQISPKHKSGEQSPETERFTKNSDDSLENSSEENLIETSIQLCTNPSISFGEDLNTPIKSIKSSRNYSERLEHLQENSKVSSADFDNYVKSADLALSKKVVNPLKKSSSTDFAECNGDEKVVSDEDTSPVALSNANTCRTVSSQNNNTNKINDSDFVEESDYENSSTSFENLSKKMSLDFSNSVFSFSSKLSSCDSFFVFNSSTDDEKKKHTKSTNNFQSLNDKDFDFVKEHQVVNEYEVPKKRRKINSATSNLIRDNEDKINNAVEKTWSRLPEISKEKNELIEDRNSSSLETVESYSNNVGRFNFFEKRSTMKNKKNIQIRKDISNVFLNYSKWSNTSPSDPFALAERQFMELLECDDFKQLAIAPQPHSQRPQTAVHGLKVSAKKAVKSAENANKKRASVIDPPTCFQDADPDDFELLENLINNQLNNENIDFYLGDKRDDDFLNRRKYSDDMSSIDSNLINEHDNLTIPEHFKRDNHSPTSTEDTDTTLVDHSFSKCDRKVETPQIKCKVRRNFKAKTKSNSSDAAKDQKRTNTALLEPAKSKKGGNQFTKAKGKDDADKTYECNEVVDLTVKPEDLFAVDDKMYAEYKIYEEMYLKEKEQTANSKKQRIKNSIKSYGIEIKNEGQTNQSKISDDSAYGSLSRSTPKPKTAKLSPLQRKRIDSASSSGSEILMSSPVFTSQQRISKFCHECGNKYPLTTAKFCVECGVKRLML